MSRTSTWLRASWTRRIVGLAVILAVGYALAVVVANVVFPAESAEPAPTPVTVSTTITLNQP